jgi:hypothetical protein
LLPTRSEYFQHGGIYICRVGQALAKSHHALFQN